MYTIRECVACVVLVFTAGILLFVLCTVLLAVEWGIERLWHTSFEIPADASHVFSRSVVGDAWRKAVLAQWNALYAGWLKMGAGIAYRSPVLVASSNPLLRVSPTSTLFPLILPKSGGSLVEVACFQRGFFETREIVTNYFA